MAKPSLKIKKKRWVEIKGPALLNEYPLGDSYVLEPRILVGKKIKTNLMTITNNIKQQNINVQFTIESVNGDEAKASFFSYEMIPSSIRRLVRRGRTRIDDVQYFATKDNKKVAVKLFLLTNAIVRQSVATTLRRKAQELLASAVSKMTFEEAAQEILFHKMQENLKDALRKVYPLRTCEIKFFGIAREKTKQKVRKAKPEEKPAETEPGEQIEEAASEDSSEQVGMQSEQAETQSAAESADSPDNVEETEERKEE